MKKSIILVFFYMLLSIVCIKSEASDLFSYETVGNSVMITGYLGDDTQVIVPEALDGYTVIGIKKNAFSGCGYVTDIYIPTK